MILYTWHILHLSIRGEGSFSVALLKVSSLFFLWKGFFYFLGEFFLIRCEFLGQGCCMCTDCKALWGKFVICDIGLYKIDWIELNWFGQCSHLYTILGNCIIWSIRLPLSNQKKVFGNTISIGETHYRKLSAKCAKQYWLWNLATFLNCNNLS